MKQGETYSIDKDWIQKEISKLTNKTQIKMKKLDELKSLVESMTDDAQKFDEKGVASAGARLRKTLQAIKKLSQEYRNEIQAAKKAAKEAKKA
jgi:hypothetical protein